ncbi:MAG TPA: peptidoglycan bridge formation glycyltransferase FemA/FemB family protein [Candidatus Saccharimonadales bacterium]|nr:peptidoglycan bridge formation glycyltransferase FemA/FemB family protein [Candidatus Saccharimonadales bacterium]
MTTDYRQWDEQQAARGASFLQSAPWGQFQASIGHPAHYIMEKDWSCLLLQRRTAVGSYLLAQYGPTLPAPGSLGAALAGLKAYAAQHGADWLRIEPMLPNGQGAGLEPELARLGARRASHNVEPALTRILDLKPSAEELLASISSTTRSFIRKNQRENFISFKTSVDPADVPSFATMVNSVAGRKGVGFFPADYYQKQAEILMPLKRLYLELAYAGDRPIGGIMMHDFGKLSSYTYAASLPEARQQNVSALLLWQALINAKARGMERLDLFGVAPDDAPPSHPWYGFSAFKRKFGGELVEHAGTWDVPITAKYKVYRSAEKTKRLLRRR